MSRERGPAFGNEDDFKKIKKCQKFPDMDCECPDCRRVQAVAREHELLREREKEIRLSKEATKIQRAFRNYRNSKTKADLKTYVMDFEKVKDDEQKGDDEHNALSDNILQRPINMNKIPEEKKKEEYLNDKEYLILLNARKKIIDYQLEKKMIKEIDIKNIKNEQAILKEEIIMMEYSINKNYTNEERKKWDDEKMVHIRFGDPKVAIAQQSEIIAEQQKKGLLYGGKRKYKRTTRMKRKRLMCPKNCCGVPVTKCGCPKSCKHCNCHEIRRLRKKVRTCKKKRRRRKRTKKKRKRRRKRTRRRN